ncbi:MAG: chromosome partitioning protein ParB [Leptolyngbya sp. ERB_1_1]
MSLNPSLIPVKKITSSQARSTFPPEVIEEAAKAILGAEGTINPIVVRQLSFQEFEVIDGHLEYYAAIRAKELDLAGGEMIDAIVVQPENEAAILEQIKLLRTPIETSSAKSPQETSSTDFRITNLEKFIEKQFTELNQKHLEEKRRIESLVREIKDYLPKPLEPLVFFNTASIQELYSQFKRIGLVGKTADKVISAIESERKNGEFTSLAEVRKRIKGLSEKRLLSLLEDI